MNTLVFGLLVTMIGIGIVFFGLVILIGLIKVINAVTGSMGKKKTATLPVASPAPAPAPVSVVEEPAEPERDENELIAVITAAIASMLDDGATFTVRRVRRISTAPAWNRAGREEQIYSRF